MARISINDKLFTRLYENKKISENIQEIRTIVHANYQYLYRECECYAKNDKIFTLNILLFFMRE